MFKLSQTLKEYTHIFGEMDLYLNQTYKQIRDHAFDISEQCGYYVTGTKDKSKICIASNNCELAELYFKNDKVTKVKRSEDDGKNWECLNFKDNLFEVDKETLLKYQKDIEYHKIKPGLKMPMSPGILIQELIKRYKMPALAVGYNPRMGHVAVETKKQFVLWRDNGVGAELLGVINKDGSETN